MKIYGKGIVWDAENDKPLCSFDSGELETEDVRVINKLVELGYQYEGVLAVLDVTTFGDIEPSKTDGIVALPAIPELTKKQIMEILGEKGITYSDRATKPELLALLEGGQTT